MKQTTTDERTSRCSCVNHMIRDAAAEDTFPILLGWYLSVGVIAWVVALIFRPVEALMFLVGVTLVTVGFGYLKKKRPHGFRDSGRF